MSNSEDLLKYRSLTEIAPVSTIEHFLNNDDTTFIVKDAASVSLPIPIIRNFRKPRVELTGPFYINNNTFNSLSGYPESCFATRSFFTQGYTSPTAIETSRRVREFFDVGDGPERVYISRRMNNSRSCLNEESIEAIFRSRGFHLVSPEGLDIATQINLWANAKLVAGTTGSDMYGLAFQKKLLGSFIINSPNFLNLQEIFLRAGHTSSIDIYLGESGNEKVHGDSYIFPDHLEREVDVWLDSIVRNTNYNCKHDRL